MFFDNYWEFTASDFIVCKCTTFSSSHFEIIDTLVQLWYFCCLYQYLLLLFIVLITLFYNFYFLHLLKIWLSTVNYGFLTKDWQLRIQYVPVYTFFLSYIISLLLVNFIFLILVFIKYVKHFQEFVSMLHIQCYTYQNGKCSFL